MKSSVQIFIWFTEMQSMIEVVQNIHLNSFFSGSDCLTNASTHLLPAIEDVTQFMHIVIFSNVMLPWLLVW